MSIFAILCHSLRTYLPLALGEWLQARDAQLSLPATAVAELAQGIAKLNWSGGMRRAKRLERWLGGLIVAYQSVALGRRATNQQLRA